MDRQTAPLSPAFDRALILAEMTRDLFPAGDQPLRTAWMIRL
jgi:hypothetical protein